MKRIFLSVCGLVLVVANTAEARRQRWSNGMTYSRPTAAAATTVSARATNTAEVTDDAPVSADSSAADSDSSSDEAASTGATTSSEVATAARTTTAAKVTAVSYSTSSAQGVANLMAASGRVGHWGGNRGPEGCGCGATPAAAYAICCYGNSGMATIDVGYAQGANGMWYCCRRYR